MGLCCVAHPLQLDASNGKAFLLPRVDCYTRSREIGKTVTSCLYLQSETAYPRVLYLFVNAEGLFSVYPKVVICADGGGLLSCRTGLTRRKQKVVVLE